MINSEENLRGQIGKLEGNLLDARSKNIEGSHVKTNLEENYATITLQIATCSNKMDSERFDPRDRAKLSNGPGDDEGGNTANPYDIDTFEDEHDRIEIPNLRRFAAESESQADLRAFSDLQPPEGIQSTHSSYASSSPMCALSFSDFPEDIDPDSLQREYDVTPSETGPAPVISEEFIPYGEYKGFSKPTSLDLQQRRRTKTFVAKETVMKTGGAKRNKRSHSLGDPTEPDPYEPYTPQLDPTPDETYLNDDSFQPEEYPYDQVDSSPAMTDLSELSLENNDNELGYAVEQNDSDDSDENYESFINLYKESHNDGIQQEDPAPQYHHHHQQQQQQHITSQPHHNKSVDAYEPQEVVLRQRRLQHDQMKRKTMPSQSDNSYNEYPTTYRPPNITSKSKSNAVPDPTLVLRPVHSAREGKYSSNFTRRRPSNNTIAGYPTDSAQHLEVERRAYSKTITTKSSHPHPKQYEQDHRRGQSALSAHHKYSAVSQPHHGGVISPEAYEDEMYQTNQPYETTINSSAIMNPDPRFGYYSNSTPRYTRQAHVYVSPQHTAVTPVNQNYQYMPNYEVALSPVDSGIYSLVHNPNIYRPQTVAAQSYRYQDYDSDGSRSDNSPQIDVHKLVSDLQAQISVLSSRIKNFEDRKTSISKELTSPIPQMTSPDQMIPYDIRSPSVTSSGSEGGRRKMPGPPQPRISSHRNSPLPTYKTKPPMNSQYEKPRDVEPNRRINFPPSSQPKTRSRMTELSNEGDRRVLHSQLSAPSINRPAIITRATSGTPQGDRSRIPALPSPLPLYPTTRSEASQYATNVGRAKSSIGTSSYTPLTSTQLKPPTRYKPHPHTIKPTSVSPQPTSRPRPQALTGPSRFSDGLHYDKKTSRIPQGDYKKRDY